MSDNVVITTILILLGLSMSGAVGGSFVYNIVRSNVTKNKKYYLSICAIVVATLVSSALLYYVFRWVYHMLIRLFILTKNVATIDISILVLVVGITIWMYRHNK